MFARYDAQQPVIKAALWMQQCWLPVGHSHVHMPQTLVVKRCGPASVSELQVMWACLQSASALHAKQLVHRDFRYANVLWDNEGPFVIDLEMAAVPPLEVRHLSSSFLRLDNRVGQSFVELV